MTKSAPVYVISTARGWKVKSAGAERASRVTATQAEAIQIGRRIATNRRSELIVHRVDGTIRSKDSYGKEQFVLRNSTR